MATIAQKKQQSAIAEADCKKHRGSFRRRSREGLGLKKRKDWVERGTRHNIVDAFLSPQIQKM